MNLVRKNAMTGTSRKFTKQIAAKKRMFLKDSHSLAIGIARNVAKSSKARAGVTPAENVAEA